MPTRTGTSLEPNELGQVRRLVAYLGERAAAQALHISRNTLHRILAQLPCQRGTIALVRQQLAARRSNDGDRTTPVM